MGAGVYLRESVDVRKDELAVSRQREILHALCHERDSRSARSRTTRATRHLTSILVGRERLHALCVGPATHACGCG
jgi:hypothetical protein